ncbi:MAG TPA: hypothetical protein VEY30_13365, partial [Myxococcaceae bacterium]|nr:hypothetical protein [Myxococcaceae bacterium]
MKSLTAYGRGVERLLLLASALAAWGFWWWLPGRLPSEAGYEEVRSLLQREAKRGDVLLVFPWWAERVRLYAPPSVPVVGYLGSDEDDLEDFERIWVLGQPELPRARWTAFAERFLPGRKQEGDAWSFGSLRLSLYRNGRFRPPRASSDAWAPSAAFVESPRVPPTACSMAADALRCTGSPAFATGPQWHEVRYRPLKCLWLHPPGGSARLTLQYPEVPEGSSAALEAGLIWEHAAQVEPGLSPVRVTL